VLVAVYFEVETARVLKEHIEEEFIHLLCCCTLDRGNRLCESVEVVLILFDHAPVLVCLLTQTGVLLLKLGDDTQLGLFDEVLCEEGLFSMSQLVKEVVDSMLAVISVLVTRLDKYREESA